MGFYFLDGLGMVFKACYVQRLAGSIMPKGLVPWAGARFAKPELPKGLPGLALDKPVQFGVATQVGP